MIDYYWRTQNTSYVYVDSDTGDDITGDGTQLNPYLTLGKAWRGKGTYPGTIVCRGRFCEDMADGNMSSTIRGDYLGAATFDGEDVFTIYGFTLTNIVVLNCIPGQSTTIVNSALNNTSGLFAGVGRAGGSSSVGVGNSIGHILFGLAGSGGLVGQSGHYFGLIGGQGSNNCIFNPKCNDTYGLFFYGYSKPINWSIHGVKIEDRVSTKNKTDANNGFGNSIFTDCAFLSDDHLLFKGCYFGSDCTWWKSDKSELIIPIGDTSDEKIESLILLLSEDTQYPCTFIDCVITDKTGEEIFTNPNKGDFTLKLDSGIPEGVGTYKHAINVPIMDDSTGIVGTWDEKTTTGLLKIENNQIVVDEDSDSNFGSITSKVIVFDLDKYSMNRLMTLVSSKFSDKNIQYWFESNLGTTYTIGDALPVNAKFKVIKGSVQYNGNIYETRDIITSSNSELTLEKVIDNFLELEAEVVELKSCNIKNVCYVRSSAVLYKSLDTSEVNSLNPKTTYINIGNVDIDVIHQTKGNYTLKPKESIVGITANVPTPNSILGVLFDNEDIPETEWIPILTIGDSRVAIKNNEIVKDDQDVPAGNGNPNYWKSYLSYLTKSFNLKYVQFKFEVRK